MILKKTIVLILICVVLQSSLLFFSGQKNEKGIFFQPLGLHDGLWHLALISSLKDNFPPNHPNFSGIKLINYHYFWDLFLANICQLFPLDIFHLYYRIIPPLLSLSFGLTFFLFVQTLFNKQSISFWSLFFCLLGGSFAYLIPLLLGPWYIWGESSFWVSQTFSNLINQHLTVSLIIFFLISTLLLKYLKFKNKSFLSVLLVLATILPFIKSYGGMVVFFGLISVGVKRILRDKDYNLALTAALSLILVLVLSLRLGLVNEFPFFFAPGWFLGSMAEAIDRLNVPILALREEYYLANKNYIGIILIKLLEFFIFIVGNLGTRTLGLLGLWTIWFRKKKNKDIHLFLLASLAFGCFFPLLFLQKGIVWNSIQFWYYVLPIISIYAGKAFFEFLKKTKTVWLKALSIVVLVFLSLPTTFKTLSRQINSREFVMISNDLLNILQFIDKNSEKKAVVVVEPEGDKFSTSLVSLYSKREVFLADTATLDIALLDYKKRQELLTFAFENKKGFEVLKKEEPKIKFFLTENIGKIASKEEDFELKIVTEAKKYKLWEYR